MISRLLFLAMPGPRPKPTLRSVAVGFRSSPSNGFAWLCGGASISLQQGRRITGHIQSQAAQTLPGGFGIWPEKSPSRKMAAGQDRLYVAPQGRAKSLDSCIVAHSEADPLPRRQPALAKSDRMFFRGLNTNHGRAGPIAGHPDYCRYARTRRAVGRNPRGRRGVRVPSHGLQVSRPSSRHWTRRDVWHGQRRAVRT
jgi:hypothetical protein